MFIQVKATLLTKQLWPNVKEAPVMSVNHSRLTSFVSYGFDKKKNHPHRSFVAKTSLGRSYLHIVFLAGE